MRRRHRILVAVGLLAPACSPPAAHRGRYSSANPPAEAGPDVTATTVATSAGPAPTSSADPGPHPPGSAGPTTDSIESPTSSITSPPTTITVSKLPPTTAGSTTTVYVLPEQAADPDEFDARDAATARVSWYGGESGSHTANGDRYDPNGLTFAHLSMPFGARVRFCGPLGCVVATCTDRGPAQWTGKTFDLSRGAFALVAPLSAGVATVTWERVG